MFFQHCVVVIEALQVIVSVGVWEAGVLLEIQGLALVPAITRLLQQLDPELPLQNVRSISAADPYTFAAVALLLATVALMACLIPAYRATRVEPVTALRNE